jgi:hypothetical protein
METIIITIITSVYSLFNLGMVTDLNTIDEYNSVAQPVLESRGCIVFEDYSVICGDQAQNYFK